MEEKAEETNSTSRRAARREARASRRAKRLAEAGEVLAAEEPVHRPTIAARLRNHFLTGLVVVAPVTITLYITWSIVHWVDNWVKPYIPSNYNPDTYLPFPVPGAGLLFAIVSLIVIGSLAANLIGRTLISAGERMLGGMPIVRNLYRGTKQIFESVVSATGPEQPFQKVAVMEFPSPGIYAIVFITGQAAVPIAGVAPEEDLVAVFMPTHLMPPSGFTVFVPRRRVTQIDMTIEDAAKIILSAGMVMPGTQGKLKSMAEASAKKAPANRSPEPAEAE